MSDTPTPRDRRDGRHDQTIRDLDTTRRGFLRSTGDVSVVYAMPAAGSAAFRTPGRAATLLAQQPGEVETFSLASGDDA